MEGCDTEKLKKKRVKEMAPRVKQRGLEEITTEETTPEEMQNINVGRIEAQRRDPRVFLVGLVG